MQILSTYPHLFLYVKLCCWCQHVSKHAPNKGEKMMLNDMHTVLFLELLNCRMHINFIPGDIFQRQQHFSALTFLHWDNFMVSILFKIKHCDPALVPFCLRWFILALKFVWFQLISLIFLPRISYTSVRVTRLYRKLSLQFKLCSV